MVEDNYQSFMSLNRSGVDKVHAAVVARNIESVEFENEWSDDHVPCVGALITIDGVKYRIGFWWCGPEIVAAVRYFDSPKAQKTFYDYLEEEIEMRMDDYNANANWDTDEETEALMEQEN